MGKDGVAIDGSYTVGKKTSCLCRGALALPEQRTNPTTYGIFPVLTRE